MFVDMAGNGKDTGGVAGLLPRRRPLPELPGVYYRPRRDGAVGPPWEFRYLDAAGKRRWQIVRGSLAEVEARRAAVTRSRPAGRSRPVGKTFAEVSAEWLERQTVSARTIEIYGWALRQHLLPAFGDCCLQEIGPEQVALFIAGMRRRGFKGWTISSVLRPLSIILTQAVRKGTITVNPISLLDRSERPRHDDERPKRILGLEEMQALLEAAGNSRERCLFELLLLSGLRIGEALGLILSDLDREQALIRVEYQLSRDGMRTRLKTPQSRRTLDIPAQLLDRLVARVEQRGELTNPAALVFASRNNTGLTRKTCREAFRRVCVAAELRLPLPTLHDLRHSHASMLIGLGFNISDVQHRLGHRRPDTTLRLYTHQWLDRDVQRRAIASRLEPFFA
jgi:integrase